MKTNNPVCVLTIAGTDPTGGAGVQADIKAISANGCYAASVITALVAQNTLGVQAIQEVPTAFITRQIDSVFSDLHISAVKIGMLHDEQVIETVALALEKLKPNHVVLDPVMVAKNGCELLALNKIEFLKNRLFPLVNLITPNIFEAEKILNRKLVTLQEMSLAAEEIAKTFNINVLVKGGHLDQQQASDVLFLIENNAPHWFHAQRIASKNTHGTGCTLSAAIASYLALGYSYTHAIAAAKNYLTQAIQSGSKLKIGHGCGPVDHFYQFVSYHHDL